MAFMTKNRKLSFFKVVEVIAETTAQLLPMEELLSKIPPQRVGTSSKVSSTDQTISFNLCGNSKKEYLFLLFIYVSIGQATCSNIWLSARQQSIPYGDARI